MRITGKHGTDLINRAIRIPKGFSINGMNCEILRWSIDVGPMEPISVVMKFLVDARGDEMSEILLEDGRILRPYEWLSEHTSQGDEAIVTGFFHIEIPERS